MTEDGQQRRGPRRYGPSSTGGGDSQPAGRPGAGDGQPAGRPAGWQAPPPRAWSQVDQPTGRASSSAGGPPRRPQPPRDRGAEPPPTRVQPAVRAPYPPGPPPSGRPPGGPPWSDRPPLPAQPIGGPPAPPARARRWVAGRVLATVLSVTVLLATGFVRIVADTAGSQQGGLTTDCATEFECDSTTILLVGSDARVDADGNPLSEEELAAVATEASAGTSTDTMMLVHIPAGGQRATAVSIPRDAWIAEPPPGPSDGGEDLVPYAGNKVNSFYGSAKFYTAQRLVNQGVDDPAKVERESSNAGRKMLISVLEKLTGTQIDHYAEINLLGFYLLSEAIGGVPVCLIAPVNDPMSGAVFAAGPQEVSGTAALSFVRQRHGLPNGDLDRIKRQQAFLSGAISAVLSVGTLTNPAKLSALVDAANRTIVLSEGFNLLELAQQMAAVSSGNINFLTIPTHGPEQSTAKDALAIDVAEVQGLFSGLTAEPDPASAPVTTDPASITVDVLNGTDTAGLAREVSGQASAAGFTAGQVGNAPEDVATTVLRYPAGSEALAEQVRVALGFGSLEPDDSIATGHVLVVVGLDYTAPAPTVAPAPEPEPEPSAPEAMNAAQPGCVN